jgi:uncharacterized protein
MLTLYGVYIEQIRQHGFNVLMHRNGKNCLISSPGCWPTRFAQRGGSYNESRLELFGDAVKSACGFGQAVTGPFCCPADQKVYIDLSLQSDLEKTL